MRLFKFTLDTARTDHLIEVDKGYGFFIYYPEAEVFIDSAPLKFVEFRMDNDPKTYPIYGNPTEIITIFRKLYLTNAKISDSTVECLLYVYETPEERVRFDQNFVIAGEVVVSEPNALKLIAYDDDADSGTVDNVAPNAVMKTYTLPVNTYASIRFGGDYLVQASGPLSADLTITLEVDGVPVSTYTFDHLDHPYEEHFEGSIYMTVDGLLGGQVLTLEITCNDATGATWKSNFFEVVGIVA